MLLQHQNAWSYRLETCLAKDGREHILVKTDWWVSGNRHDGNVMAVGGTALDCENHLSTSRCNEHLLQAMMRG